MPFLKFILKFMKNWELFRFWKLIFKYIGNFRKFYHFLKKMYHLFQNLKFSQFSYIFEKKNLTFSKIMLKVQKIFRKFEISQKLRIFQILKINFQIYRKFPKILPLFEKNYHLFQNLKFSQFSYIFEKKNLTFSKIMPKVQTFSEILKFLKNWEFFRFWKLIF